MSKRKHAPIWSIGVYDQTDKLKCTCKLCSEVISTPNYGTSVAISHLQSKHAKTDYAKTFDELVKKLALDNEVKAKSQKVLTSFTTVSTSFCHTQFSSFFG
jgi:hypothetical protein